MQMTCNVCSKKVKSGWGPSMWSLSVTCTACALKPEFLKKLRTEERNQLKKAMMKEKIKGAEKIQVMVET